MLQNFNLENEIQLPSINSVGYLYKHVSGAELIFIKNDDANKVFSVTFKTLPNNNKGNVGQKIFHSKILLMNFRRRVFILI